MQTLSKFADARYSVRPLNGTIGARIENIDLGQPLGEDERELFRRLLWQHKVLILPGQTGVGPSQPLDFARSFGDPETAPHSVHPFVPGHPGVVVLRSNGVPIGTSAQPVDDSPPVPWDSWHTDGSTRGVDDFRWTSVLQAVDVPECGRDTLFADMEAAFSGLSQTLQDFLSGLTCVHSTSAAYLRAFGSVKSRSEKPTVTHPVVMRDAETGRGTLYVNRMYTTAIDGMRPDESEHLLEFLFLQTHRPEYQLRVSWEPGTIVVWDNVKTQHYLVQDFVYPRVMHRVMANARGLPS